MGYKYTNVKIPKCALIISCVKNSLFKSTHSPWSYNPKTERSGL